MEFELNWNSSEKSVQELTFVSGFQFVSSQTLFLILVHVHFDVGHDLHGPSIHVHGLEHFAQVLQLTAMLEKPRSLDLYVDTFALFIVMLIRVRFEFVCSQFPRLC